MRISVVIEQRFDRTPDGAVWTTGQFPRSYWDRHLLVFDAVNVVARVREVGTVPAGAVRADGNGVGVTGVPYYLGPTEFARRYIGIRRAVQSAIDPTDAVLLRVSSQLATVLEPKLRRTRHPFAVEVVTDPDAMFAAGSFAHPLRLWLRYSFTRALRSQCDGAVAAAYVTETTLQARYPPAKSAYATHYSDGDLDPVAFVDRARSRTLAPGVVNLVSIGSLAQMYKSPDVVIRAVAACRQHGLDVRLTWIGDGQFRPAMEQLAATLGVERQVTFTGNLPAGDAVRTALDAADIFVLASRTEGLPRALIEAMARGLPCLATAVGGIPEILAAEDLLPVGDVAALTESIQSMANDPARLNAAGGRNLARSRDFGTQNIRRRQTAMMRYLKEETEEWLAYRPAQLRVASR